MNDWMEKLASQYKKYRMLYPNDKLMIVFDIDGTILDMRFLILHVLKEFDKNYKTSHFKNLKIKDIDFHEDHIIKLLDKLSINQGDQRIILSQYERLLISSTAVLEAHRPFRGVMDVIRWFQLQPHTYVGLNTGRPESLRANTLNTLNNLAKEYRVVFRDDLLFMKQNNDQVDVINSKCKGIEYFKKMGYRVFAVVDNEPENLHAIHQANEENDILLLHADTIFKSQNTIISGNVAKGKIYSLSKLITHRDLPKHIQFVWQWDYNPKGFEHFLNSPVHWIELDLHKFKSGVSDRTNLNNSSMLHKYILMLKEHSKKIKFKINEKLFHSKDVRHIIDECGIDHSRLWFHGDINDPGLTMFRTLRAMYPEAIISSPVDIISIYTGRYALQAKEMLSLFKKCGINRFSLNWRINGKRQIFNLLKKWGMEIDIYNTNNLESFLQAALLMPDSITMHIDFTTNFFDDEKMIHHIDIIDDEIRKTA
ncbi:MAG TPA: hypothetical protein PLM71_07850 [Syntrophorhabdaceae bacterium]|nr:hypothetical protein [Syntrophorhabdaceae bacterium]